MNEWIQAFRDLGFPIAVAAYVLIRLDSRLGILIEEVRKLNASLTR